MGFFFEENQKLALFLERDVQITSIVRKATKPIRQNKRYRNYYYLDIMGLENRTKFFEFLERANLIALQKAKEIFPWKFSRHLKKGAYLEQLQQLAEQEEFSPASNA